MVSLSCHSNLAGREKGKGSGVQGRWGGGGLGCALEAETRQMGGINNIPSMRHLACARRLGIRQCCTQDVLHVTSEPFFTSLMDTHAQVSWCLRHAQQHTFHQGRLLYRNYSLKSLTNPGIVFFSVTVPPIRFRKLSYVVPPQNYSSKLVWGSIHEILLSVMVLYIGTVYWNLCCHSMILHSFSITG